MGFTKQVYLEDAGFDWKILGPDVTDFDYVAWQCDQDAYAATGQKCSAQSILFQHSNWVSKGEGSCRNWTSFCASSNRQWPRVPDLKAQPHTCSAALKPSRQVVLYRSGEEVGGNCIKAEHERPHCWPSSDMEHRSHAGSC